MRSIQEYVKIGSEVLLSMTAVWLGSLAYYAGVQHAEYNARVIAAAAVLTLFVLGAVLTLVLYRHKKSGGTWLSAAHYSVVWSSSAMMALVVFASIMNDIHHNKISELVLATVPPTGVPLIVLIGFAVGAGIARLLPGEKTS